MSKRASGLAWALPACILFLLTASPISASSLEFSIASPRSECLVGEWFYVIVTMENRGTEPAKTSTLLTPDMGLVGFDIKFPDGASRPYRPTGRAILVQDGVEKSLITLAPGETYTVSVDLSHEPGENRGKFATLLSEPGEYVFTAKYTHLSQSITSNDLRIVVREPQGVDRKAYDMLQTEIAERLGMWSLSGADAFKKVISECPESRYAAYAEYLLASYYSHLAARHKDDAMKEKAAGLFVSAATDLNGSPLAVFSLVRAGRHYAEIGNRGLGIQYLEKAVNLPYATDSDRRNASSWLAQYK